MELFAASALSIEKLDPEGTPVDDAEVLCDGEPLKVLPSSFEETAAREPAQMLELREGCQRTGLARAVTRAAS